MAVTSSADTATDDEEYHDVGSSQHEEPRVLPATESEYDPECDVCGKITKRRCSICQKGLFCSEWCQQRMSSYHRFECSSGPLTTADYLERAVYSDEIPDDPQTAEDYGFTRCKTWYQKSHLLGLYGGLFKSLEVGPVELDRWRRDGELQQNIIEKFSQVPQGSQGAYFPWYLRNIDLLNESTSEGGGGDLDSDTHEFIQWLEHCRPFLPRNDKTKNIWALEPIAKRDSYIAYAISLHGSHPHPGWISYGLDIWYELGFCVAGDESHEMGLGGIYNRLIGGNKSFVDYSRSLGIDYDGPPPTPTCSFEEFWHAYESGRLIQLMDLYGLKQGKLRNRHLDTFLSTPPGSSRPSVWRLRHLLALDNKFQFPAQMDEAARHYSLTPRTGAKERTILTVLYRRILSAGDPLDLHNARRMGHVWTYVRSLVPDIDSSVMSILRSLPRD